MRYRFKLLAVIVSLLILAALSARAGTDPNAPDTAWVDSVHTQSTTAIVSVRFANDEPLAAIEVTLKHNQNPSLIRLDSASFVGSRVAYIAVRNVTNFLLDTAFTISVIAFSEPPIPPGSGLFCRLHFSFERVLDSTLVDIDSTTVSVFGGQLSTTFSDMSANSFIPQFRVGHLYISFCCIGNRGNVDGDPLDRVTILDLNFLVNRIFRNGPFPSCPEEANINGDANPGVTILDLNFLVNRIFRGGAAPGPCP